MKKAIIFDLDGTLLNTLPTITFYVNDTLKAFGIGIFVVGALLISSTQRDLLDTSSTVLRSRAMVMALSHIHTCL